MTNIKHLSYKCVVIIKKPKVRILDEYSAMVTYILEKNTIPTLDEWKNTKNKYIEQERSRLSKSEIIIESNTDPKYFYIPLSGSIKIETENLQTSNLKTTQNEKGTFNISSKTFDRVLNVNINQTVNTAWTASVEIDNTNNLFYLHTLNVDKTQVIFQEQNCIFEPNDEIEIYLSDWNGDLHIAFTGFINSITVNDNELNKRINLNCEDVTKKLSITRVNVDPSLDPIESEGNDITSYNPIWADKDLITVIKNILGRVYCDIFNDENILLNLKEDLKILHKNNLNERELRANAFKSLQQAIDTSIDSNTYIDIVRDFESEGQPIIRIIGYKVLSLEERSNILNKKGKPVFIIDGLNQPVWALQIRNRSWDYLISNWRSNDQLLADIIKNTFFEFFADASGIIRFRPTNLILPKIDTESTKNAKIVKENYWITSDKEVYIKNFTQTCNDREVFTDIIVSGLYQEGGLTHELLRKLIIGPYFFRRRFGVRMLPQETKIGLILEKDLEIYGEQRLWRQNSKFYSVNISVNGNSLLEVGKPIYIERWQSVFYILELSHSFSAGGEYLTEITLGYKRYPIAIKKIGTFEPLQNVLNRLVENKEISEIEKQFIIDNEDILTWGIIKIKDPQYKGVNIEGKLVWSAIPTHLYPSDLQLNENRINELLIQLRNRQKEYESILSSIKDETKRKEIKNELDKEIQNIQNLIPEKFQYLVEQWEKVDTKVLIKKEQ